MNIDTLAQTLLDKLKSIAQTETVVGQPMVAGDCSIIPVSRVSVGFGLGGNTGKSATTGTGGGAVIEPIAFLIVQNGEVRLMPVHQSSNTLHKVVDLVPELVGMFKKA